MSCGSGFAGLPRPIMLGRALSSDMAGISRESLHPLLQNVWLGLWVTIETNYQHWIPGRIMIATMLQLSMPLSSTVHFRVDRFVLSFVSRQAVVDWLEMLIRTSGKIWKGNIRIVHAFVRWAHPIHLCVRWVMIQILLRSLASEGGSSCWKICCKLLMWCRRRRTGSCRASMDQVALGSASLQATFWYWKAKQIKARTFSQVNLGQGSWRFGTLILRYSLFLALSGFSLYIYIYI